MKENRGYEIRVVSHIVLVMAVTLFSLILIVLDLYRGWDRWTIPLFIAVMIICPAIHIFGVMEERRRLYIYSIILFSDLFFYTMHVEVVSLLQKMSNTRERTITLDVEMEDYHRIKNRTEVTADATE